jgi:hypothetical protein
VNVVVLVDNLKAKVIVEQQLDVVVHDTNLIELVDLNEKSDKLFYFVKYL